MISNIPEPASAGVGTGPAGGREDPMPRVMFGGWLAVVISATSTGCVAQAPTPQADAPHPVVLNRPFTSAMTCGELLVLLRAGAAGDAVDKLTGGAAISWLDGVYAGRSGITDFPAGWARTLSQGVGGTCAITVNASRPVVDVISDLRRQYDGAPHVK
jgi:hypothetical protein